MNMRKSFLGGLVFCLGSLVFFISRCNMIDKSSYYVLECRTGNTGNDNEKKDICSKYYPCGEYSLSKELIKEKLRNFLLEKYNTGYNK